MKPLQFENFNAFAKGKSTGNPAYSKHLEKIDDLPETQKF